MSLNLDQHYVKQFASNIQLLLQQKDSRLSAAVMSGSHYGEKASPVDQIGKVEMLPVTGRYQDKIRTDATVDRRWVQPKSFDLTQIIDHFDKLKLLLDPQSSYVQNAVQAAMRQYDKLIIDAFFGNNFTGKEGTTSTSFSSDGGQTVNVNESASSNVGLTVAKLIKAKELLMAANVDVDNDPLYCAITAKQHTNLLKEAQVVSTDFNSRPVLVDGKIQQFMGINFIHTELVESGTYRECPVWAKSGMYLGKWEEMVVDVYENKNLRGNPFEIYVMMTADATRLEGEKIVKVLCAE